MTSALRVFIPTFASSEAWMGTLFVFFSFSERGGTHRTSEAPERGGWVNSVDGDFKTFVLPAHLVRTDDDGKISYGDPSNDGANAHAP